MKNVKYFIEYLFVKILFFIFKIIGYKNSSDLGDKIGKIIGPLFRSKKTIIKNLEYAQLNNNQDQVESFIRKMWGNYGRIFSEYPYLKKFKNKSLSNFLSIVGKEYLEDIKKNNKQVVFISAHFNNFELMAMQLEDHGIELAAIYRPLNNIFLNTTMEKIRENHICKNQIPKGKSGSRKIIEFFKKRNSIALMIDQRVSEGIKINFFGKPAYTTTIPAQLVKKYGCEVVPIYIERYQNYYFKMEVNKPIEFSKTKSLEDITIELNKIIEKMIKKNPNQWIWTHDRWK